MILSASSLLCLALLHFLWQGAAIAALALPLGAIARRFSSKAQSASAQYLVLCAGLLAMPIAFGVTVAWLAQSPAALTTVVVQQTNAAASETPGDDQPLLFLLPDPTVAQASEASTLAGAAWQIAPPLVAALYVLAVLALSCRLFFGLCGARRLVRESAAIHDKRLLDFLADQCRQLNLYTVPVVAYCRDVAVPTVIGVLRPTILLPLAATTAMTTEEIETILTHELVHIRRLDHLFVLVQRLLEAVFFFHPAVWLVSRRISDVREHCCDDRVIALGIEPQVYVESLLRAAELSLFGPAVKPSSSLAIALCAVEQPSRLRERILRLVHQPAPAPLKLRPVALAVAIGLVMVAIATPLAMQAFAQAPATPAAEEKSDPPMGINSDAGLNGSQDQSKGEKSPGDLDPRDLQIDPVAATYLNDLTVLVDWIEAPRHGAGQFRGQLGGQFEVEVTGSNSGSVWGTDVYTDDSDLGTAAVHAGLLKPGEKGTLILTVVKSPVRHVGSSRNGVESQDYGAYGGSFMLHRPPQAEKRPNSTAEDAHQAIRVLDKLTEEKWSQLAADPAQIDPNTASATILAQRFLQELAQSEKLDINEHLAEIHRLKTTDCRSCHQPTPTNALSFRGKLGRQFDVEIVGSTQGSIWGTDTYTDDSHIATAAVHAGLVKPGEHATITVTMVESPEEHVASERNGVRSSAWGSYSSSYILTKKSQATRTTSRPAAPTTASGFSGKLGRRFDIEVVGQTDGSVWGTDVYTDDSHIATAAVHAGVVKAGERAIVTLTIVESPEQHRGSTRYGVTTRDHGSFRSSFILQRASADSAWPKRQSVWHRYFDHRTGSSAEGSEMHAEIKDVDGDGSADIRIANIPHTRVDIESWRVSRPPADGGTAKRAARLRDANVLVLRGEFGTQLDAEVTGRTTGSVWGSDVYTDDSDIPTAAVHAGLLQPGEKGMITVTIVKSPDKYTGSSRNGVITSAWAQEHPSGYILQRKKDAEGRPAYPQPAAPPAKATY